MHHLTITSFIEIYVLSACWIISKIAIFYILFSAFFGCRWSRSLLLRIFVYLVRICFRRLFLRRCNQILISIPRVGHHFLTFFIKLNILCVRHIVTKISIFYCFFLFCVFRAFLDCGNILRIIFCIFRSCIYSCKCIRFTA